MSLPTTPTQQNADPSPPPLQPINATTDNPATVITINPPALPPKADHSSADTHPSQSNDQPPSDSKWDKMNLKVQNFLELLPIKTVYYIAQAIQFLFFCWIASFRLDCYFWNCEHSELLPGLTDYADYLVPEITTKTILYIHLFLHVLSKKPSTWYKRASFLKLLLLPLLGILFCIEMYCNLHLKKDLPPALRWTQTVLNFACGALSAFAIYKLASKFYKWILTKISKRKNSRGH